jgi:hypothetical protein
MRSRQQTPSALSVAFMFLCTNAFSFAQSLPAVVYAESFRRGSTRIVEEHFEAKLTPQNSTYRERIKDSRGVDRFVLSITPQGPEGDTEITCWQVKLADLTHSMYNNILLASQEPTSDPKNFLWRLDPSRFAKVPADAKRIIKVDDFYVVLQIRAFHFTPPDSPYLDSMSVAVELTNKDPRIAENAHK